MVDTEIMYKLMIQIYVSFQVFRAGVAGLFWVLNAEKDNFVPTSHRNVGTDFTAPVYRPRKLSFDVETSLLLANFTALFMRNMSLKPPLQCAEFSQLFFFHHHHHHVHEGLGVCPVPWSSK
jgi:hypothetical protein